MNLTAEIEISKIEILSKIDPRGSSKIYKQYFLDIEKPSSARARLKYLTPQTEVVSAKKTELGIKQLEQALDIVKKDIKS